MKAQSASSSRPRGSSPSTTSRKACARARLGGAGPERSPESGRPPRWRICHAVVTAPYSKGVIPLTLAHSQIVRFLDEACAKLDGEWLLIGGAAAAVWFKPGRVTEDIDLIGMRGTP